MPMNSVPSSAAMTARVAAAFFASGGLKARTPVAIASVPVRATDPAANARNRSSAPSGCAASRVCWTSVDEKVPCSPLTRIR